MKAILIALAGFFIIATVLPLLRHEAWWIRIFDFPRAQIAVAGMLILGIYIFFWDTQRLYENIVLGALALCVVYQGYKMRPYTVLAAHQVKTAEETGPKENRISLLISNVLMFNRDSGRFIEMVEREAPDIFLAVETDERWVNEISVLRDRYPYVVSVPIANTYGMILHSRLELLDPEVKYMVEDFIPSIHARVRLNDSVEIHLHCLHPRPPYPAEDDDTIERDAELLLVGKEVRADENPTIVMGDLNDVAWSYTTSLFQRVSGLLDPRIGRGMFSTFHAKIPVIRFPLDHLFHSSHFKLVELRRLPGIGSDHFPMFVALQYSAAAEIEQDKPESEPGDTREADEKIQKADEAD